MQRIMTWLLGAVCLFGINALAAQDKAQTMKTLPQQEQVYGWQLMSEQERYEHQEQMRKMKTAEEREAYRTQHHIRMQERARQQGVTLPDGRGSSGKRMGSGGGYGKKGGGDKKAGPLSGPALAFTWSIRYCNSGAGYCLVRLR
jgi:hypothetical protein